MNGIQASHHVDLNVHLQTSDRFSYDTITFYVLNVLSLGIYASHDILSKSHKIRALTDLNRTASRQLEDRINRWLALEDQLVQLSNNLLDAPKARFQELEAERLNILIEAFLPVPARNESFDFCAFLAHSLANYLTLGLYGLYLHQLLDAEIDELLAKGRTLQSKQDLYFKVPVTTLEDSPLRRLSLDQKVSEEIEAIKDFNHRRSKVCNEELSELLRKQDRLRNRKSSLIGVERTQKDEIYQLDQAINGVNKKIEGVKSDLDLLETQESQLTQQLTTLTAEIRNIEEQLLAAQGNADQVDSLTDKRIELVNDVRFLESLELKKKDLGPVPSHYQKRENDKECPGAQGINAADTRQGTHAQIVNKKETASQLVSAFYQYIFDRLKTKKPDPPEFLIYRLIAMELVRGAEMYKHCPGQKYFILKLNDCGITLSPSNQIRVYVYNKQKVKGDIKLYPTTIDDFTTDIGVEPDSIRCILNQLNNDDIGLLKMSLEIKDWLEPSGAKKKFTPEKISLIKTAHHLLNNLGISLQKKFCKPESVDSSANERKEKEPEMRMSPTSQKSVRFKIQDELDL